MVTFYGEHRQIAESLVQIQITFVGKPQNLLRSFCLAIYKAFVSSPNFRYYVEFIVMFIMQKCDVHRALYKYIIAGVAA